MKNTINLSDAPEGEEFVVLSCGETAIVHGTVVPYENIDDLLLLKIEVTNNLGNENYLVGGEYGFPKGQKVRLLAAA